MLASLAPNDLGLHFVTECFNVDGFKCELGRVRHNRQHYDMSAEQAMRRSW